MLPTGKFCTGGESYSFLQENVLIRIPIANSIFKFFKRDNYKSKMIDILRRYSNWSLQLQPLQLEQSNEHHDETNLARAVDISSQEAQNSELLNAINELNGLKGLVSQLNTNLSPLSYKNVASPSLCPL